MFMLQMRSGEKAMKVKNLIKAFGNCEAIVDISSTGFSLQTKDMANRDTLVLHLSSNAFDHFHCDENISMGIGIHSMFNILECATEDTTVTIDGDNGNDTISLTIKGEDEILKVAYKLWENENKRFNIHQGEYKVTIEMSSEVLIYICKRTQRINSNAVTIFVANKRVEFSANSDVNLLKCTVNSVVETAKVQTDLTDPVSFSFSLRNLYFFTMAKSLSNTVMIRMSSGLPVVLEYMIEHKGYMRFYLS